MPTFNIGQLSSGVYYDGTPIRPNQSVVPVLLVVDANGKTASLKGDPITIVDVVPPLVTGTLSQTQGATDYKITPSGLTISDDANGALKVYHILATSLLNDATLSTIIANASFVALVDYGFNQNLSYVAGTSPSMITSDITGLRVSKVYTGSSFREITHGDSIISHVLAVDHNGLKTLKTTAARRVTDLTAPTFTGFALGTVAGGSVSVSWSAVQDAGDDAIPQATNVYVGVYTSANAVLATTPSKIVEGGSATGITGFVRLITISNEATTTLNIGNGGDGGDALVNGTNYFIYAVARDAASNYSTVRSVTSTTLDTTDPSVTSIVISQTAGSYEFSASGGVISDNISGNLQMYLIMSSTILSPDNNDADFVAAINSTNNGGLESTAKNVSVSYTSGNITIPTSLKTTKFWNKTAATYTTIGETSPASPHNLRAYLVVRDAAQNIGFFESAALTVVDRTAPNLSAFSAGTALVDKVPLSWTVTEGRPYTMYIVAFETVQTMSAAEVYNGMKAGQLSRATISTSSPYSFGTTTNGELALAGSKTYYFYAVARDGAGNMSSVLSVGPVNTVDNVAPTYSGTLMLTAEGETSIKVTWSTGFVDGRGITDAKLYYGTTAPTSTSVADITTWKSAPTTYYQTVTTSAIAAAGNALVTEYITGGTEYYAYMCVKDAAGNELNVVTSPATVTTEVPITTPVTNYVNRYVELPSIAGDYSTMIGDAYGATDTAAMQSTLNSTTSGKTIVLHYDYKRSGEQHYRYTGLTSQLYELNALFHDEGLFYTRRLSDNATVRYPPIFRHQTQFTDIANLFVVITQSVDGTVKLYTNISGTPGSGPPLLNGDKNIGKDIVLASTPGLPNDLLNITDISTFQFNGLAYAHWKDVIVFPEALSLPQIQALYNKPRHVVDMHGTSMTRLGNVISKTAASETRVGIPVYMDGKAYFEFDADNMTTTTDNTWGLAETTFLSTSNYLGSEVSGTRALSVALQTRGSSPNLYHKTLTRVTPSLTTDTTTVRRTYCLAVDYTTGHAWWGIDGYFGGYNPATRVAVSGRTAQVDPVLDSTTPNTTTPDLDIRRMRYVVIRNQNGTTRLYLKSSYQYTPAGFTPFYTYEILPNFEITSNFDPYTYNAFTPTSSLSTTVFKSGPASFNKNNEDNFLWIPNTVIYRSTATITALTYACWANVTAPGFVISWMTGGGASSLGQIAINFRSSTSINCTAALYSGYLMQGSTTSNILEHTIPDSYNTWVHFAFVYDGAAGTIRFYRNGQEITSALINTQVPSSTTILENSVRSSSNNSGFHVGAQQTISTGFQKSVGFKAHVDDIKIFSNALSSAQIVSILQ